MHWQTQWHAKWQRGSRKFLHSCRSRTQFSRLSRLSVTSLKHSAIGSCQSAEKNDIWLVMLLEVLHNLQLLFCVQDCRSRRAQVEHQGQARNIEWLNANLWLINLIAFDIDWNWNIFTLHNFVHCSLTLKKWEPRTWNLRQIFRIKLWMVGQ